MFVSPVHRRARQGPPLAPPAVLREHAEELRQEADHPGSVGHALHRTNGASHSTGTQHSEGRPDLPGAHLRVQEGEPVCEWHVGEVAEPGPAPEQVVLPGRAGGEAFALHADSALGDYLGAVGLTRASSDLRDFQVMASVNFDHRDPSLLTALTSTTSTPGLNNIDFCAVPPE